MPSGGGHNLYSAAHLHLYHLGGKLSIQIMWQPNQQVLLNNLNLTVLPQ